MSFKREGNDTNLLDKLRKRRIKELFAEDIPEDEAKLLCNGRFTCTVCRNNPIFDTVSMLAVHRQGKKHLSNLEIHKAKKKELNHLIAARKHQQYIQDNTTTIKMAKSNDGGLLTSNPYDPRVKKIKVKKGERKPTLNFETKSRMSILPSNNNLEMAIAISVTSAKDVECSSSVLRKTEEQWLSGPVKHSHQLKNIFVNKVEIPTRVTPYRSKFRRHQTMAQHNVESASLGTTTQAGTQIQSHKHSVFFPEPYSDVHSISSTKVSSQNVLNPSVALSVLGSTQKPSIPCHVPSSDLPLTVGSSIVQHRLLSGVSIPPPPPPPAFASTENCTLSSVSSPRSTSNKPHPIAKGCTLKGQSQISQKLRQLQGSGWKRDWDGKWIKDEDAEFDSDEEPPDIP